MMSVVRFVPIVCVGALAVAGCNRDRDERQRTGSAERDRERPAQTEQPAVQPEKGAGTTTVTGATVGGMGNQAAVEKIVAARCAREQTCNNVGADKRYTNPAACNQKIKADMRDDLNSKDCPHGVDQKELNECLDEIRKESCNNPIDAISRLAACRTSDLCKATGAPNR